MSWALGYIPLKIVLFLMLLCICLPAWSQFSLPFSEEDFLSEDSVNPTSGQASDSSSDQPSVTFKIVVNGNSVSRVFENQAFQLFIYLNNAEPVPAEFSPSNDFEVKYLGDRSENREIMKIINGTVYKNSTKRHLYQYQLTPLKTGTLQLPTVVFKTNGQTITGPVEKIQVIPANQQNLIRLQLEVRSHGQDATQTTIYPMQSFDVSLRVSVRALPEPLSDSEPLSLLSSPPQLQIPWASDNLPTGIKPSSDLNTWLQPYLQKSGFSINGYQRQVSIFNFSMDPFGSNTDLSPLASFLSKAKKIQLPDSNGKYFTYFQYEFVRTFQATQAGKFRFGPVTFQGVLADGDPNRQLRGENVYATTPPVDIIVKSPPLTGRPDNYINAVGLFKMQAQLSPAQGRVGDPLTLTLTITGEGTFGQMTAPDLTKIKEITDHFKVYPPTEKIESNRAEFTYSIRALDDQIEKFPAVTASYFDVVSGKYSTIKTAPIPVRFLKGQKLSMSEIQAADNSGTENGTNSVSYQSRQGGIHANIKDLNRLRNERVIPQAVLQTIIVLMVSYIIVAGSILFVRHCNSDPGKVRRRKAYSKAVNVIKNLEKDTKISREQLLSGLYTAVAGFVADWTNATSVHLTPAEVGELLSQCSGVGSVDIEETISWLQNVDSVRYGGETANVDPVIWSLQARNIVNELSKQLK